MSRVIAFDADDTLWHNEWLYQEYKTRLLELLSSYGDPDKIGEKLDSIEVSNLTYYGYGIKSFTLSLIETALTITNGDINASTLIGILNFGKEMLSTEVPLVDEVEDVLKSLYKQYDLMLITKGETVEQMRKIRNSGLAHYFRYVEVLDKKTGETYSEILRKYDIEPNDFLMVGNSLRSDVLPVVEIGGKAVLIPYEDTWSHENELPLDHQTADYFQIEKLGQINNLVERIFQNSQENGG